LTPQEMYKLIESSLARVEEEILRQAQSNIPLIDTIGKYIHVSGGKRVRPALLILSSRMCGYEGEACHKLGAVVEMIHSATLVHDDIIDDANMRRGRTSVNARWGNEITVLMGDWLYMTSFSLALEERKFKILDILIDVTCKMVEGELIQLSVNGSHDITEEQHLDISRRKTAFLFSACCQIGGILGSASDKEQDLLRQYGLNIGLAFQLIDDVLDLTSTESTLGKPVGSDLKEGKLTLPLIYVLREGKPQHREMVISALCGDGSVSVNNKEILKLVREYGTADRVVAMAQALARDAKQYLEAFPPSEARDALMAVPDFLVDRDH
jgi:octaprenyl-diphosphate synthase